MREAVAWYCACGALVASIEIVPGDLVPGDLAPGDLVPGDLAPGDLAPGDVQDAYLAAVNAFNASPRTCPRCAGIHPPAELGDIAWAETAAAIRASTGSRGGYRTASDLSVFPS